MHNSKGMELPIKFPAVVGAAPGSTANLPEFVPMPSPKGHEFYTGLRRGALNQLVLPCENNYKPPVSSVSLRSAGKIKGTRLVVLASLLDYLRGLQRNQSKPKQTEAVPTQ